jgi:hypothetical protein
MGGATWTEIEYEEIHRYGRTVYETIFRLAQITFIINPSLAAALYFIFYEKRDQLHEIGFFSIFIAFIGLVYNVGAYGVYVCSHDFLERLLIRMREIDREFSIRLHEAVEITAPYSYRTYWPDRLHSFWSSHTFTRIFLGLLIAGWICALIFSIVKSLPSG